MFSGSGYCKDSPKFQESKEHAAYKTSAEWLSVAVENLTAV
jgi:hypothetical protein